MESVAEAFWGWSAEDQRRLLWAEVHDAFATCVSRRVDQGYEIEWVLLRRADFVTGVEVVLGRGPTLSGAFDAAMGRLAKRGDALMRTAEILDAVAQATAPAASREPVNGAGGHASGQRGKK